MANINQNYDGQTRLKDWWKIIKSNLNLMNDQTEKHVSGEADRHKAQDVDYSGAITGQTTVKGAVEQVQTNLNTHKTAATLDHPDGSVKTAKIADSAVTDVKIGRRSITNPTDDGQLNGFLTPLLDTIATVIKTLYDRVTAHIGNKSNPHGVTKAQVGLGNVDNTSDADKPVSTATQAALDTKADKQNVDGGFSGGGGNASAKGGGAIGSGAYTERGGSVGYGATTSNGFSSGYNARAYSGTKPIDAIQLRAGINSAPKTLQVYDKQLMDAEGHIPDDRIPQLYTKADKQNVKGGFASGQDAVASDGGAIGRGAFASSGGAAGVNATVDSGGGAVGANTRTENGGAVGRNSNSSSGGAVGDHAIADSGGAVGASAHAMDGGAVGMEAKTGNGFAGGCQAQTTDAEGNGIDAIQLGTGANSTPKTLQVYDYPLMDADGMIPNERISNQTAEKIIQDSTHRFTTDDEKTSWNSKLAATGIIAGTC